MRLFSVLNAVGLALSLSLPVKAANPESFDLTQSGSRVHLTLAHDEVSIDSSAEIGADKWSAVLGPLLKTSSILQAGAKSVLVQIPVPDDYELWYKKTTKALGEAKTPLAVTPVLYTTRLPSGKWDLVNNQAIPVDNSHLADRGNDNRLIPTSNILILATSADQASKLADETQAQGFRATAFAGYYYLIYATPLEALSKSAQLESLGVKPEVSFRQGRQLMGTVNDPYFPLQWHLLNTGNTTQGAGLTAGIDINVSGAWDYTKGSGAKIAVIDDGVQISHPDLAANAAAGSHLNVSNVDLVNSTFTIGYDPTPTSISEHGTACAGLAAAVGDNGIGVTGVAPYATLTGIRLFVTSIAANLFTSSYISTTLDEQEATALNWNKANIGVYSNSWGTLYGGFPGVLATAAIKDGSTNGNGGLGSVYVFSSGNDDSITVRSGYACSNPYAIVVGAVGPDGKAATYATPGPTVLVCAPTGNNDGSAGLFTTDLTGASGFNSATRPGTNPPETSTDTNYTSSFGGSSAAAAIVSGVVALMQSVNPALTPRDIKDILVTTSVQVDNTDINWRKNKGDKNGYYYNPSYGFGMVDAKAAVKKAATYTSYGAVTALSTPLYQPNQIIPSSTTISYLATSYRFDLSKYPNLRVQDVSVYVDTSSSGSGGFFGTNYFEFILQSPSGTQCELNSLILASTGSSAGTFVNYYSVPNPFTFNSVQFWGEHSLGPDSNKTGQWILIIKNYNLYNGKLLNVQLNINGTPLPYTNNNFSLAVPNKGTTSSTVVIPGFGVPTKSGNLSYVNYSGSNSSTSSSNLTPSGVRVPTGSSGNYSNSLLVPSKP